MLFCCRPPPPRTNTSLHPDVDTHSGGPELTEKRTLQPRCPPNVGVIGSWVTAEPQPSVRFACAHQDAGAASAGGEGSAAPRSAPRSKQIIISLSGMNINQRRMFRLVFVSPFSPNLRHLCVRSFTPLGPPRRAPVRDFLSQFLHPSRL